MAAYSFSTNMGLGELDTSKNRNRCRWSTPILRKPYVFLHLYFCLFPLYLYSQTNYPLMENFEESK